MSWVNCDRCGIRHRVGQCPQKAAEEEAERAAKARTAQATGHAARLLIAAANGAAVARYKHEYAKSHPADLARGEMYHTARDRREADTEAVMALERYIEQVIKQLRGE